MSRAIGLEFAVSSSEIDQHDIFKIHARAKELVGQARFSGKIQIISALQDRIVFVANSDVFEHDNHEKNQLEKARRRALEFLKELWSLSPGQQVGHVAQPLGVALASAN